MFLRQKTEVIQMNLIKWIGLTLLTLLTISLFLISDIILSTWKYNNLVLASGLIVLALAILISFPITNKFIETRFSRYFLGFVFALAFLYTVNHFLDSPNSIKHFQSRTGNCSNFFGLFLKSNPGKKITKSAVNLLNPSTQYSYYIAEDACRAIKIKNAFKGNTPAL